MPTVCKITLDAEEYKRHLAEVVAESRAAAEKIAAAGSGAPRVELTADTTQLEGASAQVDKLTGKDGEEVNVTVNVKQTGGNIESVRKGIEEVKKETVTIPPSNIFTNLGGTAKDAWRALTDFQGGAKKLISLIGAGGGAVGVFTAALLSIGKICSWVMEQIDKAKDTLAGWHSRAAQSIREVAEANEAAKQKTDEYMSKLGELANLEKLSNAQKAEAVSLIAKLGRSYHDLGVRIDEATGKITGFDEAMIKKAERDRQRRLGEIAAEIKSLSANDAFQREELEGADVVLGAGRAERVQKAQEQLEENAKRRMELMRERDELRRSTPGDDIRRRRNSVLADMRRAADERARERLAADYDARYSELMDNGDYSTAAELKRIQLERMQGRESAKLASKIAAAEGAVATAANDDARREAQINLLSLQKELDAEKQKELAISRQILDAENRMGEARKQSAAAGDRLREEHRQQLVAIEQRIAESTGAGAEYAQKIAVDEAEKRRGRVLTNDEKNNVSRLARLEWNMAHDNSGDLLGRADLSIKTDSLTARGGFKSGAVAPDADKWNRANNALQQKTVSKLNEIADAVKSLMTSTDDAGV